ncbi:hypothetical protein AB1N83_012499, partial [Pleurotus pulmonarius]
TWYSSMLLQT